MKKKLVSIIGSLLISYLFLAMTPLYAQDKKIVESTDDKLKPIQKIIKRDGWSIPITDENDSLSSNQTTLKNQAITLKKYVLRKPIEIQLEMYYIKADGSISIGFQPGVIKELHEYSQSGKIFAYRMSSFLVWTKEDGTKEVGGIVTPLYYSDENGDGKFETRVSGVVDTTIPAWVISTNKN